ncbi:MAG: redox-regulated ATPase YchF [Candidatus Latescibacteria bacterium]|nr:redox-regulated ATPase YchF [Candidatus Latescibacterota bacterium]
MLLSLGIIGLPNVGKTTLFNALTRAGAEASNYPFCTIDQNIGVAEVPDERLHQLNALLKPVECTPTTLQFIDIAGVVKGANRGEGLGNQFLAHIREVDAILHVVRCFENDEVAHVSGEVDPVRDVDTVNTELALADLETVEQAVERLGKRPKGGDATVVLELEVLKTIRDGLSAGKTVRDLDLQEQVRDLIASYHLLTAKPVLYIANLGEIGGSVERGYVGRLQTFVGETHILTVAARFEDELFDLTEEERESFLSEMGFEEGGLVRVVTASYRLLDLITFYTTVHNKLRAWQVKRGTSIYDAAKKIHSDIQRGFIRAEVASYKDFVDCGNIVELHHRGLLRIEGRDYKVHDGDVIHILFKV